VPSSTERGAAGRTSKGLDALGTAMLAIPNQRVDPIISDAEVRALLVRTGEALGLYPSGELLGGFSPHSRDVTSRGAGPPPDEAVEPRRQAGQSTGQRGLSRRWSLLRILAAALDGAGP
jgi:hypothetical protein